MGPVGDGGSSTATTAEPAPLASEPHPNDVWNVGHVDGLDGMPATPELSWSDECQRAYANGHRSGTLNRTTAERTAERRAERERHAIDEAYNAGYTAALADAAPIPPAAYGDDAKGSWLVGFAEGSHILIARDFDHIREMEERQRELDCVCSGSPWL